MAAVLHGFYNGVENVMKRIAIRVDGALPAGDTWHSDLLQKLTVSTSDRPALFNDEFADTLRDYMHFRHMFRHSYSFDLDWHKMEHLVESCSSTMRESSSAVEQFMQKLRGTG
ncbi:MAG: hypothetical protein ACR2IE_13420 [Candidatus Sumerlaeaceae bacterium]